jgi:glycosyltransferase involved in cell wall biosynthesis
MLVLGAPISGAFRSYYRLVFVVAAIAGVSSQSIVNFIVLFVCIPVHNEAQTAGLVLWRIRKAFAEFPREYELLVFNDGSSDATAEVLAPYADVLPVTILGGSQHVGYAKAVDALFRAALERCRYPRRDAVILMQGDLTDRPEEIPELVKRFEGGADIVVGEASLTDNVPKPVRRLQRVGRWLARRFARVPGVNDPLGGFRLFRVTVVRDTVRAAADKPIVEGDGWGANIDLLLATAPHARRIETVPLQPRYDLRPRETRVRPWHDALRLYRFGRESKVRRPQLRLSEPT